MPKEALVYGYVGGDSSQDFIREVNTVLADDEETKITIRINTPGGEPEYGWGICAKIKETANTRVTVDGKAYSFGAFALCYTDESDAVDTAQFMVHRAAYPQWFEDELAEDSPIMENLRNINKKLETAFRNKIDVEAFENLKQVKAKGITIKKIFSMDSRVDVMFTAEDAKKIKLINKIVPLTPEKKAAIETRNAVVMARYTGDSQIKLALSDPEPEIKTEEVQKPKITIMTIEKLKAEHPDVYAKIKAEGHTEGVAAEKDRVESIMVYAEIDPAGCKAAVESGKPLTQKQMAELSLKAVSAEVLKTVTADSAPAIKTTEIKPEAPKTEKEKVTADFSAAVQERLKARKSA